MQSLTLFALLLEIAPAIAGFSPFMRFERTEWSPARETGEPRLEEGGISPAPTNAPRHPRFGAMPGLDKRYVMGTDTCGFDAEYKSNAWTCFKNDATCATTGSFLGCCVGESPACLSTILTTCIDFTNKPESCGPQTLCCPSSAQSCFTWQFKTSVSPTNTYSIFNCYSSLSVRTGKLVDAPPGETGKTSSKNINPTSDSSSTTSSRTSTGSTSSTSSAAPTDPPPAAQQSAPVGAIVGGVVGGLAVLGIAGIAIFYLLVRRKKGSAASPTTTMASTAVPPSGPGGASPMTNSQVNSPYYGTAYHQDPNMQQYGAPYGYYPPEQKVPGQEGYYPANAMAPQLTGTTDGAYHHGQPSPTPITELPTQPVQRHELS